MSNSSQTPAKLSEANLRNLSRSASRKSVGTSTVASSQTSRSSASSKASSATSQGSSFWVPTSRRNSRSIDSYSSKEDEVRIRYGHFTRRIARPSISSEFSFPPTPKRSPSPAVSANDASKSVFAQSLGLSNRNGPVIVLMRHCHSESNYGATRNGVRIPDEDAPNIRDPPLSDQGKIQASKLSNEYSKIIENVRQTGGKVLVSHLLRAKQTAFFGFPELLSSHRDLVEIRPELQETFSSLCDTGKAPQDQEAEFPGFDYSRCTPEVNIKKGIHARKAGSICANAILKKLKHRPEPILFLITHGHTIVELVDNRHWKERTKTDYQRNGEATVYAFQDHTTKLHPVSAKYAAEILGKPT